MRLVHESPADIDREKAVAAILAERWNCKVFKLPKFYRVDYAMCRGWTNKIEALVEIKCRPDVSTKTYETYMLSVSKLMAMDAMGHSMDVPALLVVQWSDFLGYHDVRRVLHNTGSFYIGGRTDRDDEQDQEPVVYIPISLFKEIGEIKNV